MEAENKSFFSFPAEKVSIQELEEGEYMEEKEQNPNYITINGNKKIFRINIIATLVHKELRGSVTSMLVDDGTGKITLQIFEENKTATNLEVGEVVQIIGKIRVFNQEKYIFPEIIKKINLLWLKVRFLELQKEREGKKKQEAGQQDEQKKDQIKKENATETTKLQKLHKITKENNNHFEIISEEIEENNPLLPFEKVSKLITELDRGEGVMIEELIEKSHLDKTEEILEKMLENGDIFQNMPGKVKLL